MESDNGKIGFSLELDNNKLKQQIASSGEEFKRLGDQVVSEADRMDGALANIGKAAASLGMAWSMQSFAKQVMEVRGQFQQLEVAFNTMLGSADKAKVLMSEMVDLAARTPFDLQGVASGAKQLLAYGVEANEVTDTLTRLGDIAAGLSIPLNDIVYLYGTTITQGRMYTMDLRQFMGRGIPLATELAKQFGVTKDKVADLVSEGKVGAEEFKKAIKSMTDEGSQFGGLMDAQSKTISGQIANIEDAIDTMFNDIGQNSEGLINTALSGVSYLVENYKQVAEVLGTLVASYGVYKATLMAVSAYTNAAYGYEITQLKALLAEKGAEVDADLAAAVSKGRMTAARAQEVQALRAELAAKIENAKAIAVEAENEARSATIKRMSAQLAYEKARAEVAANQEAIFAMEGYGAQETINTLNKERDVLVTKMHAAQEKLDAAAKLENAAKTKAATTAQTVNTLTTQRDTLAKKTNTTQTTLLTLATNGLKKALNALKVAWATNPVGLILMGVTLVAGALMTMSDNMESASEEVTRFGESATKTLHNVDTLMAVINNTSSKSKTHEQAVDDLCKIYEEYGVKIDDEIDKLDQLNDKREEVIRLIKEEGEERQKANQIQSYEDAISESTQKMKDDLLKALQNAEWEGSGVFDDWDADEYKERAEELAKIIGSIMESESDELAKLSGDAYEQRLQQINEKIKKAYQDLGLDIEKEFWVGGEDGQWMNLPTDVNEIGILDDYIERIRGIVRHRDDLINSYQKSADGANEEAEAVDYSAMSFDKLFDAAYHAKDKVDDTKSSIQMLGGVTAQPTINTSSIDNAINQTNTLINNMMSLGGKGFDWRVPTLGEPRTTFGFGGNSFGLNLSFPWATTGNNTAFTQTNSGNSAVVSAQNELQKRLNTALRTRKGTADLLKEVNTALDTAIAGSDDEKRLLKLQRQLKDQQKKFNESSSSNNRNRNTTTTGESPEERRMRIQKAELDVQKVLQESSKARQELQQDLARQEEQNEINLEEDANKRRLRQLQLDQAKEQDQLKKQQEQAVNAEIQRQKAYFDAVENERAARNKKYVKRNFTDANIDQSQIDAINAQYEKLFAQLEEQQKKSRADMVRSDFEAMRDYLKNYGTYQQQRLAVAHEYEKKIQEATSEGEKRSLARERDSKLAGIETQELKANIDWTTVFGEFGGMFHDLIAPALEDAKKYIQTDEFKNSDQDSQKAMIDAIQQMQEALGSTGEANFKQLGDDIKAYQAALSKLKAAQQDNKTKTENLTKAQEAYQNSLKNGTEEEQAAAKDRVDAAQKEVDASNENVQGLQEATDKAKQTVTDTANTLKTGIDNVVGGLQQLSSKSLSGTYQGLIQFGKGLDSMKDMGKIGDVMGKLSKALENVPIIGAIASILDILKDGISDLISGLIDTIFSAVSNILDDVLSGDLFKSVGESILTGINNIFDAITFGGFGSLFGNGDSDKNLERDIERLTEVNSALANAVEELTDAMEDSAMVDAAELYQQQVQLLAESEANTQEMMRRSGKAYSNGMLGIGGHRSSNHKIDKGVSDAEWQRISDILKFDVRSASEFWQLTSEQMRLVAIQAPDIYGKIKDLADNGYKNAAQYMDDYIDFAKQREELEEAYYEKLTNLSFDNLRDEFKNALTDMEGSAADFANDFNKLLVDSIAEAFMTNKYDDKIKALYKKWAKYMESDGELDDKEIADIQKDRDAIYQSMQSDREFLQTLNTSATSQNSSSKGFATASQDSIDELNGRFTAIQMDTSVIRETLAGINADMAAMNLSSAQTKQYTDEIRNISLLALDHLEAISRNTHELFEMNERLGKIEKNTRRL